MAELTPYRDELVAAEMRLELGTYLRSYATEFHLVEVHLFEKAGELLVYVTKAPGVPMADAQSAARDAAQRYERENGTGRSPQLHYDAFGMGRTGSL